MALPKKKPKKTLASQERIKKAIEAGSTPNHTPVEKKVFKKMGRPVPVRVRDKKISVYIQQETFNRLNIALPQEKIKRDKEKKVTDKSLIVEDALIEWLDKKGY